MYIETTLPNPGALCCFSLRLTCAGNPLLLPACVCWGTHHQVRRIADKSYTLEAWWYDNLRDRLPIPQPKSYWTGCEHAADSTQELGNYGVLMGWLGDDLVKAPQSDGVTEMQNSTPPHPPRLPQYTVGYVGCVY